MINLSRSLAVLLLGGSLVASNAAPAHAEMPAPEAIVHASSSTVVDTSAGPAEHQAELWLSDQDGVDPAGVSVQLCHADTGGCVDGTLSLTGTPIRPHEDSYPVTFHFPEHSQPGLWNYRVSDIADRTGVVRPAGPVDYPEDVKVLGNPADNDSTSPTLDETLALNPVVYREEGDRSAAIRVHAVDAGSGLRYVRWARFGSIPTDMHLVSGDARDGVWEGVLPVDETQYSTTWGVTITAQDMQANNASTFSPKLIRITGYRPITPTPPQYVDPCGTSNDAVILKQPEGLQWWIYAREGDQPLKSWGASQVSDDRWTITAPGKPIVFIAKPMDGDVVGPDAQGIPGVNTYARWEHTFSTTNCTWTAGPTPAITGLAKVGQRLVANPGTWTPSSTRLTYQWYSGASPIPGAQGPTHTVTTQEVGMRISVEVRADHEEYNTVTRRSAATAVVPVVPWTRAPAPVISGKAVFGSKLTATTGSWSPTPETTYVQWLRDASVVASGTSTYTLGLADIGHRITARTVPYTYGYAKVTPTSTPTAVVTKATFASSVPTVTFKAGNAVSHTGAWSPKPDLAYQWYRNGVAVYGENGTMMRLLPSDRYNLFQVRVTGSRPGYATRAVMSAKYYRSVVTKGARCSTRLSGAYGYTPGGVRLKCTTTAKDSRLRWRTS